MSSSNKFSWYLCWRFGAQRMRIKILPKWGWKLTNCFVAINGLGWRIVAAWNVWSFKDILAVRTYNVVMPVLPCMFCVWILPMDATDEITKENCLFFSEMLHGESKFYKGDIDPISKSCWGWHWVCKLSEMHNSSDKTIKLILAGAYEWYRMLLHDGKCHIVVLGGWWRTGFMKCRGTCLGPQTYLNTNCDQCSKSNRKNQMALNLAFACLHDA